jgi:hypothetical protein
MIKGIILALTFLLNGQYLPMGSRPITSGGGVTPTFVQGVGSTGVAAFTQAFSSNVTSGNALIAMAFFGGGAGTSLTFTDSLGNSWATIASASLLADGDTMAVGCTIAGSSAADTITSNQQVRWVLFEVQTATCTPDANAGTCTVGSGACSNTLLATSCNSGALTTSTANDLLIGFCGTDGSQTATWGAGSGWSHGTNYSTSGTVFGLSEFQVATSPGSFTATSAALPTTSGEQTTILVAFKP